MRVTVHDFRCYRGTHQFEFPAGGLTLLSGASGTGKSTILAAITWGLHGKLQKIRPHADPKATPCVMIEGLGGGIIRRVAPSTLDVQLPDKTVLSGDPAQGWIHRIVGKLGPWTASSTLYQEERNPLLTLPNTERFALLHAFTYGDDETEDPEFYLEKVKRESESVKNELMATTGAYNVQYANVQQQLQTLTPYMDQWPYGTNFEILTSLPEQIKDLRVKIIAADTVQRQYRESIEACTKYNERVTQLEEDLSMLPLSRDIAALEAEKTELIKRHALAERSEADYKKKTELEAKLAILSPYSYDPVLLETLLETRRRYNHFLGQCMALGISPETLELSRAESQAQIEKYRAYVIEAETAKEKHHQWREECAIITGKAKADHDAICTSLLASQRDAIAKRSEIIQANQRLIKDYDDKVIQRNVLLAQQKAAILKADAEQKRYDLLASEILETNRLKTCYQQDIPPLLSLINEKESIQMRLRELFCPHCSNGVTYDGVSLKPGTLSLSDRPLLEARVRKINEQIKHKAELDAITERLAKLTGGFEQFSERPVIPTYDEVPEVVKPTEIEIPIVTIEPVPSYIAPTLPTEPIIPPVQVDPSGRLASLMAIEVVPLFDEQQEQQILQLKRGDDAKTILEQLEPLKDASPMTLQTSLDVGFQLQIIAKRITESQENQNKRALLGAQLAELCVNKLVPLPKPTEDVDTLTRTQNELEQVLAIGTAVQQAYASQLTATETYAKITGLSNRSTALTGLAQIIRDTSAAALATTVDSINTTVNSVVGDLFDDPIEVTLLTVKELKSKEKTKAVVNLQIKYRETTYDGLAGLSGGEKDRISLALTIGIARMTGAPIVMLDECMASLDGPIREKCLKAIRRYLPQPIILHVCHETISGFHDQCIDIATAMNTN